MSESLTADQIREALALWEKQPFQPASYQTLIAAARLALAVLEGEIPLPVLNVVGNAIAEAYDKHPASTRHLTRAFRNRLAQAAIEAALAEWALSALRDVDPNEEE